MSSHRVKHELRHAAGAGAALLLLTAAPAFAQKNSERNVYFGEQHVHTSWAGAANPLPSGTVGEEMVTATATVKKLDLQSRMVTLERADGSLVRFRVHDDVRNLPQVKVGDEVTATYYESLAFAVRRPGDAAVGASVEEELARAAPGQRPGATGGRVTTVTTKIEAIDKAAGTVTIRGPDGEVLRVKVRDPKNLDRVAVGELVEITLTEAVAISVDTPRR